jgi:hypothetical protein
MPSKLSIDVDGLPVKRFGINMDWNMGLNALVVSVGEHATSRSTILIQSIIGASTVSLSESETDSYT